MSAIALVRHGQAGFGQDDYDVLSELGVKQSVALGQHWARTQAAPDSLYVGPRRRHLLTAEGMLRGAEQHGQSWPQPQQLAGFDEFAFGDILQAARPQLATEFARLSEQLGGADPLRHRRTFEPLFQQSMQLWITGQLAAPVRESFADFVTRVHADLTQVMTNLGRSKSAIIVTSAGPIAAALQLALQLPDLSVLKVCTVLANTSLAELRFRVPEPSSLTALGFNATPHLTDPALLTYR